MLSRVLLLTTLALFLVRCSGSSTPDGDGHDDDDDGDESLVFSSCDTTPHGGTDERECYTAATVPFGGTCALTTQTRTCANGAWSPDFPESCLASCTVAAADACGITANGDSESRTCYGAAVVPFGSTCTSAEHTRTCANGTWTPDWPSCAYLSCEVAPAAACDGQPHGTVENRTCYSAASVPPGQTCGGTNQSRTCDDGDWSSGYASCPYLTCVVEAGARCGSTLHDAYESRACYAASAVAFANECTFAWQDRLCDDGGWSPDYSSCANLTCSVGAPPDYSSEHGWLVDGTGCTPSTDEREYDAIAVGSGAVYVSYRLDLSHVLHKLDAVTGAGLDSDQGNGTGGAGVVADATGVYSAGWVNQHGYLEKRDLATLDHIAGFGTYATGVRRFDNEPILRLEGRDSQLWLLVERYTASGYDWYLTKVGGADAITDTGFGTSGIALTTYKRGLSEARPAFDVVLGATHLYFVVRIDNFYIRIEKRDLASGALASGFGDGGILTMFAQREGTPASVAVFEHLGRLYVGSSHDLWQLNNGRGNVIWGYDSGAVTSDIIADATGVYIDDRIKLSHDGVPLWTSTALAARNTSLAIDGHWLYAAGNHAYTSTLCSNMRYRQTAGRQSRHDGMLHP